MFYVISFYLHVDFFVEMVDTSPPTVKLHFQPKGVPNEDRKFYLAQKEDRCVACGEEKNFIRKHVIPLEYRKLVCCVIMPTVCKSFDTHIYLSMGV